MPTKSADKKTMPKEMPKKKEYMPKGSPKEMPMKKGMPKKGC